MLKVYKDNNFDFLRLLFALLVVISHSYPLSGANESGQWICQITGNQMSYASIGLNGFFVISGYFIYKSLERSISLTEYYFKRFLRLFPGLLVLILITLFLVPFVYESNVPFYLNSQYYTYLPFNLSLYGFQSGIKGIFDTNFYHAINGSLWTIRYEFSLYIALSVLFFFRSKTKIIVFLLSIIFFIFYISFNFFIDRLGNASVLGMLGWEILNLGTFFIMGSLLASLRIEGYKYMYFVFVIALLILLISIFFNKYILVKHFVFPFIILFIGFKALPFFSTFGKYGDPSYGIYIYSFPIQQTLVFFFKLKTYELMFYSVIISIVLGYLSWHLIEKKALKFKKIFNPY